MTDPIAQIEELEAEVARLRADNADLTEIVSDLYEWSEAHAIDAPEWRDKDKLKIYVSVGLLRKVRDALAGDSQ